MGTKKISSVLSGFNFSLLEDIHVCTSETHVFNMFKTVGASSELRWDVQLGIVSIEVVFDAGVVSNNFA